MTKLKDATAELERESVPRDPVFCVVAGRGGRGKSTGAMWLVDRARDRGREVIVADGDRKIPTLAGRYPDALRPPSAEDQDVREWVSERLDQVALERKSLVLDLGGGDRTIETYRRSLDLVGFCEDEKITPVLLYFVGPELQDLEYISALESAGVFRPKSTVLVLNAVLVRDGQTHERAFDPMTRQPEFVKLLERAVPVIMPRLACMDRLPPKRSFYDVRREELGPTRYRMLRQWLSAMENDFSGALEFLP